jgi:DNA-directed DNA polymerase III PolC
MPVSLHTHSWYSLLEGISSPETLLQRAADNGNAALALTDTNNLYGAVAFVERSARYGIRPILGVCLKQQRTRCVALIAEPIGYCNLCRVISRINLAPLQNVECASLIPLLCESTDGLHVLVDDATTAAQLREAFGKRLWLEIVRPRNDGKAYREQELLACGQRLGLRLVASTAAHFAASDDYATYRVAAAVRQNTLLDQLPPMLPITPQHYLASPEELRRRFADLPDAVANTDALADQLNPHMLPRDRILPPAYVPRQLDATTFLHKLCERGLSERHLNENPAARQRLKEELAIIQAAQLETYFLTVRDIARYARHKGHSMALRGSAGNSLVCYLLYITDVDPLRFQLPFERFLYLGRPDLPDIDLDFDWKVRDEVIAHVTQRYGAAHTARISSHLFLQPKSAFREAGKIHGLSNEQISKLLTKLPERVDDLQLPETPPAFPLEQERWPRIVADARRLLGRPHHLSLHPGGVVITPGPIEDHVPLEMAAKGVVMTQFEKDAVEFAGLVKIDLLGNRALSVVDEAWIHIAPAFGREVCHHLPAKGRSYVNPTPNSDVPTLDLLQRGDTLGITQLESPAMRHLLIQMQPTKIEDVIQTLALVRPGPASFGMKESFIQRHRGEKPKRVLHPRLASLLADTYGVMLYEDDALRLLREVMRLDAASAEQLRKRIAKHQTDDEAKALLAEFLKLAARQGVPTEVVEELWRELAKFNRYTFCRSHAVSYGLIAWQAAYLKAHQPLAFWTAALNNAQGSYPRRVYIEAIKRAGIEVRLPCVNRSSEVFTLEGGAIRTGLDAIVGFPQEATATLLRERKRNGPFQSLTDLRRRVPLGPRALAMLICSGALDWTERTRPALFFEADLHDAMPDASPDLFGCDLSHDWTPADYNAERRLLDEWRLLEFITGPPLLSLFRRPIPPDKTAPLIRSDELSCYRGRRVRVYGLVATGRHTFTEDGRPMQFVTLEDEHGFVEVTLFPGTCPQVSYLTMGPYLASGIVEEQYGVISVSVCPRRGEQLCKIGYANHSLL